MTPNLRTCYVTARGFESWTSCHSVAGLARYYPDWRPTQFGELGFLRHGTHGPHPALHFYLLEAASGRAVEAKSCFCKPAGDARCYLVDRQCGDRRGCHMTL
eukprot:s194_g19.t1